MIEYEKMVLSKGVRLLKDEVVSLILNGKQINIIGMDDITISIKEVQKEDPTVKVGKWELYKKNTGLDRFNIRKLDESLTDVFLKNKKVLSNGYNIAMIHRPEGFKTYSKYDLDLIFSGHAHGGRARIPLLDISLLAVNQGILPRYTSGVYRRNGSKMIVSKGLGYSANPYRVFSTPDLNIVKLVV